jgi:hypothetical protein
VRGAIAGAVVALLLAGCGDDGSPPPPVPPPATRPDARPDRPAEAVDAGATGSTPDAAGPTADGPPAPEADAGMPPTITLYDVPAPVAESCRRYAETQCARWKECIPARFASDYAADDICRARRESTCRADFLVVGRQETPANRDACTQAIAAQSCRDMFFDRALAACAAPAGALARGQACFRTSQCGAGMNCEIEVDSCGTCQPNIPAGGDCGWWGGGCAPGTFCFDDRCLAELKVTQACKTTSATCEGGLGCTATGCADKTLDEGASCAAGDLCDSLKGLYCNFTSRLCARLPPPVAIGQPCDTYAADGAWLSCGADGFCFTASTAIGAVKRCLGRVDLGQACDPAMGKNCRVPAVCTRGACRMPVVVQGGNYTPTACK